MVTTDDGRRNSTLSSIPVVKLMTGMDNVVGRPGDCCCMMDMRVKDKQGRRTADDNGLHLYLLPLQLCKPSPHKPYISLRHDGVVAPVCTPMNCLRDDVLPRYDVLPKNTSNNLAKSVASRMFANTQKGGNSKSNNSKSNNQSLRLLSGRLARKSEVLPAIQHSSLISSWKEECQLIVNHKAKYDDDDDDDESGTSLSPWEDLNVSHPSVSARKKGASSARDGMEAKRLKFYFSLLNESSMDQLCHDDDACAERLAVVYIQAFTLLITLMRMNANVGESEVVRGKAQISQSTMDKVGDVLSCSAVDAKLLSAMIEKAETSEEEAVLVSYRFRKRIL
eukprot:767104-Hanusia_phi.AAC.5